MKKVPGWAVGRLETVTGESRGTLAVLFIGLVVGVIAAVVSAFLVYRTLADVPPVSVPGKVEGVGDSTEEQDTRS